MEKNRSYLFMFGLIVWVLASIYLSLNSILGLFIETNPYIAKFLSSIGFIIMAGIGSYNYYKNGQVIDRSGETTINIGNQNKTPKSCKTCKQRKNGNV